MKRRGILDKKAISPMIATVILIAMVMVIALMVFLWFKNMSKEAITKFNDQNIEVVCGQVEFDASYSAGTLSVVNNGNVPIYGLKVNVYSASGNNPYDFDKTSSDASVSAQLSNGINQGGTFSTTLSGVSGATKIVVYPVLLGNSKDGTRTFVCSSYGLERTV